MDTSSIVGASVAQAASNITLQAAVAAFALGDPQLGTGVGKQMTEASGLVQLLQQLTPNLGSNVDVRA